MQPVLSSVLLRGLGALAGDPEIASVVTDSREAGPGSLFVCIRGERVAGHDHAPRAPDGGEAGGGGRGRAPGGRGGTRRRGEGERGCRAFLQPVRGRREDWYQGLPTPLGTVRRDQWLYLGPPELSLEETNGLCVEWNGLRFAVRAAQPVCVGEETLYWWALLAVEDGEAQTEQT